MLEEKPRCINAQIIGKYSELAQSIYLCIKGGIKVLHPQKQLESPSYPLLSPAAKPSLNP